MDQKDISTAKVVANFYTNLAAISGGIALFEKSTFAILACVVFLVMAIYTIRRI